MSRLTPSICVECAVEMRVVEVGVVVLTHTERGDRYRVYRCDREQCPICKRSVLASGRAGDAIGPWDVRFNDEADLAEKSGVSVRFPREFL